MQELISEQIDTTSAKIDKVAPEEAVNDCPPDLEPVDLEEERERKKTEWASRLHEQEQEKADSKQESPVVAFKVEEEAQEAKFEEVEAVIDQADQQFEPTEAVTDLEELD